MTLRAYVGIFGALERRSVEVAESPVDSDLREIYLRQIAPLMSVVIDICKREGIPMAATFQLTDVDEPLYCTTTIPVQDQSQRMNELQVQMTEGALFLVPGSKPSQCP